MNRQALNEHFLHITACVEAQGGEVDFDTFAEPATEQAIAEVEYELGFTLPNEFRAALQSISAHVLFFWQLPDERVFDAPNDEIFSGHLEWDLQELVSYKARIEDIITNIYQDETDAYDAIWRDKLPFLPIGNGDYLALELLENRGAVVYLSHDGSSNHGRVLAQNFAVLVENWAQLGFVGAEDWQWEQFSADFTSGIDPKSEAAMAFRKEMNF